MSNKVKIEILIIVALIIATVFIIRQFSSAHQVNTTQWSSKHVSGNFQLTSPVFPVNSIYKSMKGPVAGHSFQIDASQSKILWLTGYQVEVLGAKEDALMPDDFLCHNNMDFNLDQHLTKWNLKESWSNAYPRLFTLTQGQTSLKFPEGFGFPVYSDQQLSVLTQVLNHNITDTSFGVRHLTSIQYTPDSVQRHKPLFERSVFVMLPFNEAGSETTGPGCIPVDPNDHRYDNEEGGVSTGHWVIEEGKSSYEYNITKMLDLAYSSPVHYIGVHTHPFAERLELWDITADSLLFHANCDSHSDRIGLKNIEAFSDEKGILFSHLHQYKLIVFVDNNSGAEQDMMASMFLYFYDREMDEVINTIR